MACVPSLGIPRLGLPEGDSDKEEDNDKVLEDSHKGGESEGDTHANAAEIPDLQYMPEAQRDEYVQDLAQSEGELLQLDKHLSSPDTLSKLPAGPALSNCLIGTVDGSSASSGV